MSPIYKRWYDHDPLLLEVVELLRNYQDELKVQAAIDKFYELVKPVNGNRWYDNDPVISRTVELLRVVPPDIQKVCAERFIDALHEIGVDYKSPNIKKP